MKWWLGWVTVGWATVFILWMVVALFPMKPQAGDMECRQVVKVCRGEVCFEAMEMTLAVAYRAFYGQGEWRTYFVPCD